MVRHIVMYRLRTKTKEENARQMKEKLEGLNGKIEGCMGCASTGTATATSTMCA